VGRLLNEVLAELSNAFVLGLTATLPATLTPGQAERFAELAHGLTDPSFGSIGFLEWVDRRFVPATEGAISWHRLAREEAELCDAALRLHHVGLVGLDGAPLLEQHRQPPTAEDWVALIDDCARRHLQRTGDPADEDVVDTIRRTLPAVGYRWTRAGIRRGRSPVDRLPPHSEAKTDALAQIISTERRNLAERLRMPGRGQVVAPPCTPTAPRGRGSWSPTAAATPSTPPPRSASTGADFSARHARVGCRGG
jgi:hypothetical protein